MLLKRKNIILRSYLHKLNPHARIFNDSYSINTINNGRGK